jgi:hypothetical protein
VGIKRRKERANGGKNKTTSVAIISLANAVSLIADTHSVESEQSGNVTEKIRWLLIDTLPTVPSTVNEDCKIDL